jgi:hypothetical protein
VIFSKNMQKRSAFLGKTLADNIPAIIPKKV